MYKLVINPTFKCSFECNFCYVKKEKETYKDKLLDISALDDIFKNYDIKEVAISGGEPTTCDYDYMISLINKIKEYYDGQIDFETNFYDVNYCRKLQEATGINMVVGYDFHVKPFHTNIWENMYEYPLLFDIKTTATHFVVKSFHPNLILKKYTLLRNLKEFEFDRYMKNFYNQWLVSEELYDKYMNIFLVSDIKSKEKFKNARKAKDESYLLKPIFLNPDGLLYVQQATTIVEFVPFTGKVPELPLDFQTYTPAFIENVRAAQWR